MGRLDMAHRSWLDVKQHQNKQTNHFSLGAGSLDFNFFLNNLLKTSKKGQTKLLNLVCPKITRDFFFLFKEKYLDLDLLNQSQVFKKLGLFIN